MSKRSPLLSHTLLTDDKAFFTLISHDIRFEARRVGDPRPEAKTVSERALVEAFHGDSGFTVYIDTGFGSTAQLVFVQGEDVDEAYTEMKEEILRVCGHIKGMNRRTRWPSLMEWIRQNIAYSNRRRQ